MDIRSRIISAMYLRNNMVCHLPSTKRTDWSRSEKTGTVEKTFESIVGAYGTCIVLYNGSVVAVGIFGTTMYNLVAHRMERMMSESSGQLLDQTATNLETYLKGMRRVSDTMYYSVIKDKDLAVDSWRRR